MNTPQTKIDGLRDADLFADDINKGQRCGMCGGAVVLIRGKYPGQDRRAVCPTCAQERLEQIQEIAADRYGVAESSANAATLARAAKGVDPATE